MKIKLWILFSALVVLAVGVRAYWVYNAQLVNTQLSANTNYTLDLNRVPNTSGMTYVSATAVYSSGTLNTTTFTDGSAGVGSVTVASNVGLSSAAATNTITVAPTSVILGTRATDQFTITNSTAMVGMIVTINGNVLKNGINWTTGVASSNTAVSLASAINAVGGVRANAVSNVIYSTAALVGIAGNSFTAVSSSPSLVAVSSSNYSGGTAPPLVNAYLTYNGNVLKQGYQWYMTGTSSGTAASIAHVMNFMANTTASSVGSVVYATTTVGLAGNAFTLTSSSPSFLTVASPTFTGGQDNASVTIGGVSVTQGTDWTVGASAAVTAKNIAAAINAKAGLSGVVVSSQTLTVVTSTATSVGTASNYSLTTSTPAALVRSGATFTGGTNPGFTLGSPILTGTNNFTSANKVTLTTGGGTMNPFTNSGTYYTIPLTSTTFELANTSTGAVAGLAIVVTSSSTQTSAHTFTVTPSTFTGPAGLAWFESNDGVNYLAIPNVSSTTISSTPSGSTTVNYNLGQVNYRYVQLQTVAPSAGSLGLVVTVNGSN